MSAAVGESAVRRAFEIAAQNGYKTVKLKYAGGEPTLNFPLVKRLAQLAQEQAQATGLKLESVLLSNGFSLTEAMVTTLKEFGIRLMISLDGLGIYQDGQRRRPGGQPTSRRVLQTLDLLDQKDLKPHISITISRHNLPGLPDLLSFLTSRGYSFHLNFFRENPYAQDPDSLSVPPDILIAGLKEAYRVLEAHLPNFPLSGALLDRVRLDIPHDRPCGACNSYLVIRTDGSVSPCQMVDEATTSLMDPNLLAATFDRSSFQNPPVDSRSDCQDCLWRMACAGGCPLLTVRTYGNYQSPTPYCQVYRSLIPSVLRLEGLRMRKLFNEQRLANSRVPITPS